MHTTDHPALDREQPDTTTPPAAPLGLDARLAARDADMTVRLEQALLGLAVDADQPETTVDPDTLSTAVLADYAARSRPAPDLYPTPAAATLQRAAHRLLTHGWCRGATRSETGAMCMYGAIRAEAPGPDAERDALHALLHAIRRRWPHLDDPTVPSTNDQILQDGRSAARLLGEAADLAHAHYL